ncbi:MULTISPECIES: acyl carrier protein [unclassified Motilimonas]|uniref:acyl carrier protein n=1 Tax=Motilimonas TaxID=1914248 RepID=UPI001E3A0F0A|nr:MULTISPECIES: acyl carrier protein [unclassified Motilimonas]MCE0556899.1 acyl carrier protein [Motilimonas sp. E26]MDO6525550.1 acyl carrier protein [Motilimonas sp. 1_MG-2023]
MILQNITKMLEEVLGVEQQEITLEANLVDDLAAESIDFVDIIYALEQEYDLTIAPGDIFPAFLQQGQFLNSSGEVSDEVRSKLNSQCPHLSSACLSEFYDKKQASIFFRVSVLVDFIEYKQNTKAVSATQQTAELA